jgi:outer membrane protein insertion porin family
MFGFLDTGGIFDANESIRVGDFRSSIGIGISWISPVGPLRLAFARPLSKFDSDKIQSMQFQIGTTF